MPLLMCPNCNVSTQPVRRHDVELDMCPQCRGVWMDRGELEKVLELERGNLAAAAAAPPGANPWSGREHRDERPRYDDRRYDDARKRHSHKRRSIFDIFDD